MVAASNICGQPMSLLVYDQKLNKITEYSSDDSIRLESVYDSMTLAKAEGNKRTRANRLLVVKSVDAAIRFGAEDDK